MTMAHVCFRCGSNLARFRAVREPPYGLPIVVCPTCRSVCVRRRHPTVAAWRKARRIIRAVIALIIRAGLLALFIGINAGLIIGFADSLAAGHAQRMPLIEQVTMIVFAAMMSVATGAMIGFAFSHLRPIIAWLSWGALFVGSVTFIGIINEAIYRLEGFDPKPPPDILTPAILFAIMWLVVWAGMPIGWVLRRLYDRFRVKRKHAYRAQRRQRSATK